MDYSEPKITKQGKRYFVTFTFTNNKGEKDYIRTSGGANRIKSYKEQQTFLKKYRDQIAKMLREGWNPSETADYLRKNGTIREQIEAEIKDYEGRLSKKTYIIYKSTLNKFLAWLDEKSYSNLETKDISRSIIREFLEYSKTQNISNRTVNNRLRVLKATFTYFIKKEIIEHNPCFHIDLLPETGTRHKVYTKSQVSEIAAFLKVENPRLYLMLNFILYAFVRPETACKIQLKHIDVKNKTLYIPPINTNKQRGQTKILVPQLLENIKPHLKTNPELFLLSTGPGKTVNPGKQRGNRDWYSRNFKNIKEHFNLDADYTFYGFRHTAASDIYLNLRNRYSKDEAESKLMHITGHTTRTALRKYLKNIGADLPADYSALYSFEI